MTHPTESIPVLPFNHDLSRLYADKAVTLESLGLPDEIYPNKYYVVKCGPQASALVRVSPDGKSLLLVPTEDNRVDLKPRNKEQALLLSTLMDPRVQVQVVTGQAGTGKTMLAIAAAMAQVQEGTYDRIIITRPMSQVGRHHMGSMPGDKDQKFAPFLMNYGSNVEQLLKVPDRKDGSRKPKNLDDRGDGLGLSSSMMAFIENYRVEMIPLALIRGASLNNAFIIADEVQVLDHHEMMTLGTRVAGKSKLVLMGDLDQRDEKIKREETGLYRLTQGSDAIRTSSLVASIELVKVERGPVAELFTQVFSDRKGI